MFKIILTIFVSSVVTVSGINLEIQPAVVATCDVFNRNGLTCRDCSILTRCVLMNDVFQSYDVDLCDTENGYFCNSFENQCSNSPGPCNPLVAFACSEEGYFPNPFTCQEYYTCIRASEGTEIVSFKRNCASGTAYSAATQACSLSIHDSECQQLQWSCNYPGDLGLWPGSEDIFYLCLRNPANNELVPELHKCINNQIFDGTGCVARNGVGTTSSTPTSGSNTTETTTLSTTESSVWSTTDPFTCSAPGLFPNPNNCRQYYQCDSNLSLTMYECPNGTYFQPSSNSCVWGDC